MTESDSAPQQSRRRMMRGILLDIAPPLIGYYGLRAAGASEYVALLTATVLSGLKVTYDAVKAKRLDPFAAYLMLTFGLSLAVALATTDPKLILAGNTGVNGISGLIFLASCVVGTPLTQVVAQRFQPVDDEPEPGEEQYVRRVHVLLSAMWGIGLLIEVGVRLVAISRLSVDVANGVTSVISWATIGVLMAASFWIGGRAHARWEQRAAPQG
ncbi:MAG TPA: VC0807 family protein [Mycobacterium sp.]|jgi:uncharacterized membrane protein|nr:VC0807 family protein [Mycobacterium sp.]